MKLVEVVEACVLALLVHFTWTIAGAASPYLTLTRSALQSTSGWLNLVLSLNLTQEEVACIDQDQVLYKGECYDILSDDPCGLNEWLILDKKKAANGVIEAICSPKKCFNGSHYMAERDECVSTRIINNFLCKKLEFSYDVFGEGRCHCNGTQAFLLGSKSGICYEIFQRRPCPGGYLFVPVSDVFDARFGECKRNHCFKSELINTSESLIFDGLQRQENKKCRKMASHRICGGDYILVFKFAFSNRNLKGKVILNCFGDFLSNKFGINVVAVSDRCVADNEGRCVKVLNSSSPELEFPDDFFDE